MRLTKVRIKNFRALTDIEAELSPGCNVVVGPNAVGKTTVLDAIRVAKAVLAPRTQNEANQVLMALGAISPHSTGTAFEAGALANHQDSQIEVECEVKLDEEEIAVLGAPESLVAMATQLMLSSTGRPFAPPTDLVGLLSTPHGQQALEDHRTELNRALNDVQSGHRLTKLALHINPKTGQGTSPDPLSAAMIGFLDRRLPPGKTIFSHFPADRAIPSQEQPVQIGPADANNQLESHNSQPQLKYSRLKNTIFNAVVSGRADEQGEQFKSIFTKILRGRSLHDIRVSERAVLKINVRDDERGKTFAIDAMSSGEKDLILTCLLIAQTMQKGGVVLLDEPELHLNPSVRRDLLNFLADEYADPLGLQMVICSHSPEILGVAFERDDCELYHLVSGDELAPVRKQDLEEVGTALKKLGASQNEGLLYRGTIFVEGEHDEEILQEGFSEIFQRYMFRELGGRKNVEKEVQLLQTEDRKGRNPIKTSFILDNDGQPTSLKSTDNVRVLQWDRRCLENYLLDCDILTDIVKDSKLAKLPITNTTALKKRLKELAFVQLNEIAFWARYNELFNDRPLKQKDVQGKSYAELAGLVATRMAELKDRLSDSSGAAWASKFAKECESKEQELRAIWDQQWDRLCDGKQLIRKLHTETGIRDSLIRFKIRIIQGMASKQTPLWREVETRLKTVV